jgi:hypothetical protein
LKSNGIENIYVRFFTLTVRIFLFIMIAAFIFNVSDIVLNSEKAADVCITAIDGGELGSVYLSHSIMIFTVRLLSASLIITFSYLVFLFYRKKEILYSVITASIVLIISTSAVLSFL